MKKLATLLLMPVFIFLISGCSDSASYTEEEKQALIPMVMVGGTLYLDTGLYNTSVKCGVPDGEITSSVEGSKKPSIDNQSNFGIGYEYQYGTTGTLEVNVDSKWRIFATEGARQNLQFPSDGSSCPTTVLKSAPALTVLYDDTSVEALKGTSSWRYLNDDGVWTGIEADSLHPLEAKEHMTPLNLLPSTRSSVEPLRAYLEWDVMPDLVTARCWSAEQWGHASAQSETVSVDTIMLDSDIETSPIVSIELKDGNYVYEVSAEWSRFDTWRGSAHYSFYTIGPNMKRCPIE